jgi:hypothetical protein
MFLIAFLLFLLLGFIWFNGFLRFLCDNGRLYKVGNFRSLGRNYLGLLKGLSFFEMTCRLS